MAFSENLKKLRLEKNFTQEYVAKSVGVSQPVYNGYENGLKLPSLGTAKDLAVLFGITVDELIK